MGTTEKALVVVCLLAVGALGVAGLWYLTHPPPAPEYPSVVITISDVSHAAGGVGTCSSTTIIGEDGYVYIFFGRHSGMRVGGTYRIWYDDYNTPCTGLWKLIDMEELI